MQTGFLLFRLDASPLPDPSCPWNASRVRTRIGAGSALAGDWKRQVNRKTETLTFNSQTCAQCFLIVPPPRVKSGGLRILSTVGHCLPQAPRPKWRITIGAKPQSQLHTHCCFFSIFFMAKNIKKHHKTAIYIYTLILLVILSGKGGSPIDPLFNQNSIHNIEYVCPQC